MNTIEKLLKKSFGIMKEKRTNANSAERIGSLFRDIVLYLKNLSESGGGSTNGLSKVTTDETLTGDGTSENPLGISDEFKESIPNGTNTEVKWGGISGDINSQLDLIKLINDLTEITVFDGGNF